MKPNKLRLLPLAVAVLAASPAAVAQERELDMTMTIMEEGQQPEGLVRKIPLPSPAEAGVADDAAQSAGRIADEVREESGQLVDEAVGTVTDTVKDVLSIEGAAGAADLPGDIVDNLSEDLPLLDEALPELPQGDLPQGTLPQEVLPQDATREAGGAIETMDAPVDEARDAGSELGDTLEETRKLIP